MVECVKCGACCTWLEFEMPFPKNMEKAYIDYYRTHGCKVSKGKQGMWKILVPSRCQHLTSGNLCDIYGSGKRPLFCKAYKGQDTKYYVPPECAFKNKEEK